MWVPILAATTAALLSVAMAGSVQAQSAGGPGETVAAFGQRVAAGDVEGALALLSDDVVIIFPPCLQAFGPEGCVGKEQAAVGTRIVVEAHAVVTLLDQSVSGSSVIQRREVTSDIIRAAGVERIVEDVTYDVSDGLISRLVALPDASDPQTATFLAAQAPRPPATGNAGLAESPGSPAYRPGALGFALLAASAFYLLTTRTWGSFRIGWWS
ncbi:MAG: nuclear transport factor 2 family protein [Dehalococcoidia bacterium]